MYISRERERPRDDSFLFIMMPEGLAMNQVKILKILNIQNQNMDSCGLGPLRVEITGLGPGLMALYKYHNNQDDTYARGMKDVLWNWGVMNHVRSTKNLDVEDIWVGSIVYLYKLYIYSYMDPEDGEAIPGDA